MEKTNEATIIEKIKQRIDLFKLNGKAALPGFSTGYTKLDDIIGGFQEGHLITLAARTGHGKSWIALNFLINIAIKQSISSLLISLEMSHDQNMYRLLSLLTGIAAKKMKDGDISEDELMQIENAHNTITKSPLAIEEDTALSNLKNLSDRIKQASENSVKFVVIDHVGLIHESEKYSDNRTIEMGKISRKIKMLAKKLKIHILICAQLNRDADNSERPKGSQLRESDTLKQDSDILMLLHRPEKYDPENRAGELDVIIDKNRDGEEATISFNYNKNSWEIFEASEEVGQASSRKTSQQASASRSKKPEQPVASKQGEQQKVIMRLSDIKPTHVIKK